MKLSLFRWGMALLASLAIAGCGGGGGGGGGTAAAPDPSTGTAVNTAITTASALSVNDTSINPSGPFTVLQGAGVPVVTINSPPKVNFTVFSDGAVKTGLTINDVRFAIAKLVPGSNGNPDEWVSYVSTTKTGVAGKGPGGNPVFTSEVLQATTDSKLSLEANEALGDAGQFVYNPDGYYTYTFKTDIKDLTKTAGVAYEPTLTHRIAIQLSYKNAAGATVLVNPYYDFTIVDGKSVPVSASQTRKMTDVASCNSCHEKLALHGGGRIDTQYCVMCHNPGTTDPESGNVLTLSTMVHSIHAGRRIKAATGDDYTIWGYGNSMHDYAEVGFPQDLRNCTKCHSASNPATPQGDNWKTAISKESCLSCHSDKPTAKVAAGKLNWYTSHTNIARTLVGSTATAETLTNKQCVDCHKAGTADKPNPVSPEWVHWNQNEENAAKYKMNIESATYTAAVIGDTSKKGTVTVKYYLSDPTNGNIAYDLKSDTTKFGQLALYVAYQNMTGLTAGVTEFTSYNNGDGGSFKAIDGVNVGNNRFEKTIDVKSLTAVGTGRIISIGQIKELELAATELAADLKSRKELTTRVNTLVQNTHADFVISGTPAMPPRRQVVSNAKCNDCHGALGATSGSNTLANAFHSGARNTVEACALCHDANRASSGNMMTNGSALYESYQFKNMIHGIHGNSKRTYPFNHGNKVVGKFSKVGALTTTGYIFADVSLRSPTTVLPLAGTTFAIGDTFETIDALINAADTGYGSRQSTENYAAEVAWPGVGINCNACHVNNSYKNDQGNLGMVVMKPFTTGTTLETDATKWNVISPKAASCVSCHDGATKTTKQPVSEHVADWGSSYGTLTQAGIAGSPAESCGGCHAPGAFKGVDIVHGQK